MNKSRLLQKKIDEAKEFIHTCYKELGKNNKEIDDRIKHIIDHMDTTGTYQHTYEELNHGAKMAWRNSNRCIGRLFWESLQVFDARELKKEEDIVQAVHRHIDYASNSGKIRPTITVFRQATDTSSIRIWNHQLIRYACYETENGLVGDPHSLDFTRACEHIGWKGKGTPFDVLPLVVQLGHDTPKWFSIPEELIMEIDIRHPKWDFFDELKLKWYAVPIISDMVLEIGGISYTMAPFNGWYMETEIGARNLADPQRYNTLPMIASLMGLNTKTDASLWKDMALVELNIAVLHSFKSKNVSIVDHHTAAKQFERFEQLEADSERRLTGEWAWLIPPVSPATTHIFHKQYDQTTLKPNFFYQKTPF